MRTWLPPALGLAITLGAMSPGIAPAQSLEQAFIAAYANNPTLMAQRATARATDEEVSQALGNWRPSVSLSGDAARSSTFNNTRTTTPNSQIRSPRGAEINVTQPVFRGFRTVSAVREAKNSVRAERARLMDVEQTVLVDVAAAFMDVVRDQAVLDLNINNEQVLKRQLEATRDRFQVGEITRTDVHQAEARLAGATADRVTSEGDLETSRAAYINVVGASPGRLEQPAAIAGLPDSKGKAIELARQYYPTVVAAQFDERVARERVRGVRGELLPTVSLVGKLSRDLESSSNRSRADEGSITAQVSIPIFQQGIVYSRLRQAKQTAGAERLQVDQARRNAIEKASRAWDTLSAARARIKSFSAQVQANEVALEGVQREAAVGSRTVLDVLDAEQELLDAKVNLVRAERDQTVAAVELRAAAGELTARGLNLQVDYYDPRAHYQEVRDKWAGGTASGEAEAEEQPYEPDMK